ncbi:MAG: cobaltochelatase subunit CobN [Cyanobacteria bacterium P01_C01_bin.89]
MHRLAAAPGGWDPSVEGVVFIEQTPAPIVIITPKDTEIQTLAGAIAHLPKNFPKIRACNQLNLQQQLTIDTYADDVLSHAEIIVVRLLGGKGYWSYGLEVLEVLVEERAKDSPLHLIVIPGDDQPDPGLMGTSTVPLTVANQVWRYFSEGGIDNFSGCLLFLSDRCLGTQFNPPAPAPIPRIDTYKSLITVDLTKKSPKVGIGFYRSHFQSGNTQAIDALIQSLAGRNIKAVPVFLSSLKDVEVQEKALEIWSDIDCLLMTTGFAIGRPGEDITSHEKQAAKTFWEQLGVPVIQTILSSGPVEQWRDGSFGLAPRDMAMHVALPEVDGRIIGRAIAFKTVQQQDPDLETMVVTDEPLMDRVEWVSALAESWVNLRRSPAITKKVALILANYPNRDGRLANGVGLDTPQSCVDILWALSRSGYNVGDMEKLPKTGDELIQKLTAGTTNDPASWQFKQVRQTLNWQQYKRWFKELPLAVQKGVESRWGNFSAEKEVAIAGIEFGNIFVGIQPARGYDADPTLNYHAPDLEPTHEYLGFYLWLRIQFQAQAIVHVGKHGNLEWLPGKSIALSENCYSEVVLGPMPHFYPFIVNDPGEGSQAKRRSQAVIIDHLTPPLTRAELYGNLSSLEGLVDEYYEAQSLDPKRTGAIASQIETLVKSEKLDQDLAQQPGAPETLDVAALDGYLCELKEAQIRDGLHIFGSCPSGEQLRDLMVAIARSPGQNRLGITRAIAADWGWDLDPLTVDPAVPLEVPLVGPDGRRFLSAREAIAALESAANLEVEALIVDARALPPRPRQRDSAPLESRLQGELSWIRGWLWRSLQDTSNEMSALLSGLAGRPIPAGPAGAPTRGRPEVLPTGRNFYSVDIRALPTESAWDVGRRAAELVIERYTQEHGDYPKTLGLSVWGTSTMRTGGDDIAEALALIGVQPIWDGTARRVVDFQVLPVSTLGRPRVDVTLRISGFFRDAFPNLIDLFDRAVQAVAALDESPADNPIAHRIKSETQRWIDAGLPGDRAALRASYRVFGSKPGAYGAGLQGLIESKEWQTDEDLARAYVNWSSYAYTCRSNSQPQTGDAPSNVTYSPSGRSAPEAFASRLETMEIVLHNQDNREHDLLDSDDYYQFQGGLTAAVKAARGVQPVTYFGDRSRPENPKVRRLSEEIARVYRSRVVNPKWIAGVMRHGYKGAFEMAATVDYLFAYDATAHCAEDFMYEGIANAYLLDPKVQDFVREKNPWALRDMAERLLEANQRGLWGDASSDLLDQLQNLMLDTEAKLEGVGDVP